jgi:hypothetical protein
VADDDRYCSNCRALIPPGAEVCPACGVFAGSVFDGKMPKQSGRRAAGGGRAGGWVLILLLLLGAAGAGWWYFNRQSQFPKVDTGPIRVVGDRPGGARRPPGAAINEPEAVLILRHSFAAQPDPIKGECVAVISRGYKDGHYSFDAVDSCRHTSLGRWRVDAHTRAVSQ